VPDFSVILQQPMIRQIVQENILERSFHDALFPRVLYRAEASPQLWAANIGDSQLFTGSGIPPVDLQPLRPGFDPNPVSYQAEQWRAQCQGYGSSIDTHMPTSVAAIADLFLRNSHNIGLQSALTLNRLVRNKLYNTGLSGHTVADTATGSGTTALRVKRLNGFTTARRPDLAAGSPVRFDSVSASNPLPIYIGATMQLASVIAVTPDTVGDEMGPGVLTLAAGGPTWADRDPVMALDRTFLVRSGGGLSVDALNSLTNNVFTCADIRAACAHLRQQNVPAMPDGYYHCHLDTISESEIFGDAEWQRLQTSLPDYFQYREFAIGVFQGCVFLRNTEAPLPETVAHQLAVFPTVFQVTDPFVGELVSGGSNHYTVHRPLFLGQDNTFEYYSDLGLQLTEAGVTGRIGVSTISNNGIEINTDRIQIIIRAPLNRLQDMVATTWKFQGDWPTRTDAATGDLSRYKRACVVEHV